jgi:hypothetical protein
MQCVDLCICQRVVKERNLVNLAIKKVVDVPDVVLVAQLDSRRCRI